MITTAGLVDFHCHLDLYPDHPAAVRDAEKAGVFTLAVTTTPRAWPRNHELAQRTTACASGARTASAVGRGAGERTGSMGSAPARRLAMSAKSASTRALASTSRSSAEAGFPACTAALRRGRRQGHHGAQHPRRRKRFLIMSRRTCRPIAGKIVLHWFTGTKERSEACPGVWAATFRSTLRCWKTSVTHRWSLSYPPVGC